ncbi:Aste57867_20679 [Aphanomyces stellatus]|uniref:Aste57867_20679 protein n=1 Tax=Aphanomyces stellatus TaxID=120398 RepID=A0A485LFI7_9STRA|nr:hypothetical protein As57867_020611 [Aphanomyces stellatus]VFT97359.1 Aste57867_20679 [Aphanomyces stellatus]
MHFFTILKAVESELLPKIKGSRFIGFVGPVSSREEALQVVASRRAKFPQANHHCFAYALAATNESYCSDDGEPHNTAGRPIQQVLSQHKLQDVCLVVSRIFGGTKLGTGGLVRAYGGAAEDVMTHAVIEQTQVSTSLVFHVPIRFTETVKKSLQTFGGSVTSLEFGVDTVEASVRLPVTQAAAFESYLRELSGGRASVVTPQSSEEAV